MKILKYALGIIAVLLIAFLAIGVFIPSYSYETEIVVNAPLEKSWMIFNDVSRMGEWLSGFQSIETISGDPGEVGSKYRLVFVEDGEEIVLTEEMTAIEENELFAFNFEAEPMTGTVEVHFEGDSSTTTISSINHVYGKNIFWRPLLWLSKGMIRESAQGNYEKLKEVIESSPVQT